MKTHSSGSAGRPAALLSAASHLWLKPFASLALLLTCCFFTAGALAQAYPSRPITIVVPFPPGAASDLIARALGAELAEDLKQPVVVDNRPGASGVVAGSFVARAAPNGYTLMVQLMPNLISPSVLKTLPYSGNTGFAAVAPIVSVGGVLVTSAKLPVSNLSEFVALLKANPGKHSYGSAGVGSPLHAWAELFQLETGTKALHVPYKGYAEQLNQMVNGDVDFAFAQFNALQFVASGKLKAMGVTAGVRDPDYPSVPTLEERGLKGFRATLPYFLVAPKGTPPEILQRLNTAVAAATARESFVSKVRPVGGVEFVRTLSPAQTAEWIAREDEKYDRLIREKRIIFE